MKRKFYVSYVRDSWDADQKIFDNAIVLLDVPVNKEKQIPVLLQQKLSDKINDKIGINNKIGGRFFPITLINFWEID